MSGALWSNISAATATCGRLVGDKRWEAFGVTIDSRQVKVGDLFLALSGDRVDGHEFVQEALESGSVAAIVEREIKGLPENSSLLVVEDVMEALNSLASEARKRTSAKIIAITGSVGKTSTKDSLAVALREIDTVHSTVGNLNNHIGAPLSLARLHNTPKFAVFELGMNHKGELSELSKLIRPHLAMITNVHSVHLEYFKNEGDIAEAKAEIFHGLEPDGQLILNQDNLWTDFLKSNAADLGIERIVTFGISEQSDVRLLDLQEGRDGSRINISFNGRSIGYELDALGRHRALNSVGVLACVYALNLDVERAADAIRTITPSVGRGKQIRVKLTNGGSILLIDESYNASPIAMKAAFSVLANTQPTCGGRRIVAIGDMLELGDDGPKLHADLLEDLLASSPDVIFTVGTLMKELRNQLPSQLCGTHAAHSNDVAEELAGELRAGDVVLVKGSLGTNMSSIISAIEALTSEIDAAPMASKGG